MINQQNQKKKVSEISFYKQSSKTEGDDLNQTKEKTYILNNRIHNNKRWLSETATQKLYCLITEYKLDKYSNCTIMIFVFTFAEGKNRQSFQVNLNTCFLHKQFEQASVD